MKKTYTTALAARAAKVSRATLQEWIASGRITAPAVQLRRGKAVRLWTVAEIAQAKKFKGTLKPGPKPKKRGARR